MDEDEGEGGVMLSRSQHHKRRAEMEWIRFRFMRGLKKMNSKRGDEDGHATTSARTAKRADNDRRSETKTNWRSSYTIYSEDENDDDNPRKTFLTPSPLDVVTAALYAQICGLLIGMMSMSRASSSSSVSSLFKLVMQDRPSLKTQRSEREWVGIFNTVLHGSEVGKGVWGVWEG